MKTKHERFKNHASFKLFKKMSLKIKITDTDSYMLKIYHSHQIQLIINAESEFVGGKNQLYIIDFY